MAQQTALERAFELARLGQFASLNAILEALRIEGLSDGDAALQGAYIRGQLTRVIESAAHLRAR
jgi:hypothetical protein